MIDIFSFTLFLRLLLLINNIFIYKLVSLYRRMNRRFSRLYQVFAQISFKIRNLFVCLCIFILVAYKLNLAYEEMGFVYISARQNQHEQKKVNFVSQKLFITVNIVHFTLYLFFYSYFATCWIIDFSSFISSYVHI